MVLKRADFGRCEKSSQTLSNVAIILESRFPTIFEHVGKDSVRIRKCLKSTNFEQKAWAIAHGFEEGGFW